MSAWGAVGYAVFMLGCVLELFGHEVGTLMSAPGGLFEVSLSVWLLVKGFSGARPASLLPDRAPHPALSPS